MKVVGRCQGITRAGKQCSITASSDLRDRVSGRLAAEPLRSGGQHCLFHAKPFILSVPDFKSFDSSSDLPIVIFLDLETSSLDVINCSILEIGAVVSDSCAAFSSLVRPGSGALQTQFTDTAAAAVHGIALEELMEAPSLTDVFRRFVSFMDRLALPFMKSSAPTGCADDRF